MLTVITTPGGSVSNSYASRAEADAYHEGHLYGSTWFALPPAQRDVALVMATRVLDEQVEWAGWKTNHVQALRWPRGGVPEMDGGGTVYDPYYGGFTLDQYTIPPFLKNATAELARSLAAEDRTADSDLFEFSQVTIGPLSLTKDQARQKEVLPDSVRAMVKPYGQIATKSGIGFVRLVRA